ncbi:MAG: septum formation initiator family protein [Rhodospirillales bacterium]|jgi:cell division protein FtsB|nr:septum formation initiator family protein [Rhodospirillales bacterium]
MGLIAEFRLRAKYVIGPVLGICVVAYFAYHVVQGDRGMIAWWNLKQRVATARAVLHEITETRQTIQHRVGLLHPGSLDRDMLDERARLMLNYGKKDELIIFPKQTKAPREN